MLEKTKRNKTGTKTIKAHKPAKAAATKEDVARTKSRATKKPAKPDQEPTIFSLNAPEAREVCVAGTFSDWALIPLHRDRTGLWIHSMHLEPGAHEYRFVIDGVWSDDPMNITRCWNEFGTENCIVTVSPAL